MDEAGAEMDNYNSTGSGSTKLQPPSGLYLGLKLSVIVMTCLLSSGLLIFLECLSFYTIVLYWLQLILIKLLVNFITVLMLRSSSPRIRLVLLSWVSY